LIWQSNITTGSRWKRRWRRWKRA